ncbi:hypothetical protein C0992_007047, partial [Termitomyces sp. T32_za158]
AQVRNTRYLGSPLKWEDKLTGYKIHIIMNHKALEFFKTQVHLPLQQHRWIDYMLHYQFDITYVKGELNKVVDCLSRYFESNTCDDIHEAHEFVQADKHIDPKGKDLPLHQFQEIAEQHIGIRAMQARELHRSKRLKKNMEARDLKAQCLADAWPAKALPHVDMSSTNDNLTVGQALNSAGPATVMIDSGDAQLHKCIQQGYVADTFFVKILDKPKEHLRFQIKHQLIYMMNTSGVKVLCILKDRSLITTILEQAHNIVGHFGY